MSPPERPTTEIVELHRLFLDMRQHVSENARRRSAFQMVLHSAAQRQLARAGAIFMKRLARRPDLRDDVVQVATLILVGWLTADSLCYEDRGAECFGGWYWTVCRNAIRRALQKCADRRGHQSVESLAETEQPLAKRPTFVDLWWDDVLAAIANIHDRNLQAVMIDMAAGRRERQTAQDYQLSLSTVSKLRHRGVALLRRTLRHESVD
jgi:DNA-directed RNA polymerase specialized sigma24 family protein